MQLEAIIGSEPYPDREYDPKKRIILNAMKVLHDKYGITEYDLEDCELWFLPHQKPEFIGIDKSMISGFGQDNWATAFPLLDGFLNAKKPFYTKIAIFYDREEVGDSGRGGLGTSFFTEILFFFFAYVVNTELGHQYRMIEKSWRLFADVAELRHALDRRSE